MKLAILGGGGVRMPAFVRAVLASRPGTFDEICLFEPDPGRRDTICRLASGIATTLGYPDTVTVTADAAEAFVEAGSFYDRATCDRFAATIFSVGNSVAPDVAFRNFRGRDVDINALMRDRGFPVT